MTQDQTADPGPADLDQALAAETALGLLDGAEAQAAVTRMAQDPAFAASVRDWTERFAGLAMDLTPVMAPARARQAIRERLGHSRPPLSADPTARPPVWRRPWAGLAGLLAAAAVAAVLWLPAIRPGDAPAFQAELSGTDSVMLVQARLDGTRMEVTMQARAAPEGRDWELWWIAPDGAAPVSLGVVPRDGVMRVTLPDAMVPSDQVQLALSEEPQGGSPGTGPTGPVVATGRLTVL